MTHPRVSVILTSFNHANYLRESIDSILAQSFSDFELIIWDDHSSDDSWNIIQSYDDPRVRPFRNEQNERKTINKVLRTELPRGEFIAIHHSDDAWHAEKLQKQVDFLDQHPDHGAVFTHAQPIDENSQPLQDSSHNYFNIFDQPNRARHDWLRHFLLEGNVLCHPSLLIRRECYKKVGLYKHNLVQLPDLDMWIRLSIAYEMHVIQERLTLFRVRDNEANMSGDRPENLNRINCEKLQLLENYTSLKDVDLFLAAFPEAAVYPDLTPDDIPFVFALVALQLAKSIPVQLFAVGVIHKHFSDHTRHAYLKAKFQYDFARFFADTGAYDVFNEQVLDSRLKIIHAREDTIKERETTIKHLEHEIVILKHQLNMVLTSRSWSVTRPLRYLTGLFSGKKAEPFEHP